MLFNIVRLRHLRLPVFLQVSSVVTQFGLSTNVGGSGAYAGGALPVNIGGSVGVTIEERPTITYTPLQGEEFVRRLATPLSVDAIAQTVQAGWRWDAVLACCVQQINGQFAPSASRRAESTDFRRVGAMLRSLQTARTLSVRPVEGGGHELVFAIPGTEQGRRDAAEVRTLLGLDPDAYRYKLSGPDGGPKGRTVSIHGRSMMATLAYVSQGVEGPSHGTPPLGSDALLHVRSSNKAPRTAYASVEYEQQTFYIARDDEYSQGMFVLLNYLFSLMSAPGGGGPVVTIGAGG